MTSIFQICSPRGPEWRALQPCCWLVVPRCFAFLSGNWKGERMVVMLAEKREALPCGGKKEDLRKSCLIPTKEWHPPYPLTQFPVTAERDHVAMLASVTHYDSEIPASLNQGLSRLLHEVRVLHGWALLSILTTKPFTLSFSYHWSDISLFLRLIFWVGLQLDQVAPHYLPSNQHFRFHSKVPDPPDLFPIHNR